MGIIQLKQIQARVTETYGNRVDVSDATDEESALRSRGLAAWVVEELSGSSEDDAADAVVDGFHDNGLDAIHVDLPNSTVYLVQSKWSANGTGSTSLGDVHKFAQGFRDLVNAEFDRFNDKVRAKQEEIERALNDPNVGFVLVLAHTGAASLSSEARVVIEDLLSDVNDPIDTATFESLTQVELHDILRHGVRGTQPDLHVTLHEWGHTQDPYAAYYGQVDASAIADWFATHRSALFDKNLREFLGRSSEVNASLLETLRSTPERFWYLNNGITVLCERVSKTAAGSTMKRSGTFEFVGASIVNGAQTVGCIGEAALEDPALVADARVMVRFISLENCPTDFAAEVTRGTNTQNRVERRDFVALDTEQVRLREELSPEMAVQAKREIGRLWIGAAAGTHGSLYRRMFNGDTTGHVVWRAVRVLREVDKYLTIEQGNRSGRERQIGVHGNRILAHLIFQELGNRVNDSSEEEFEIAIAEVESLVRSNYATLVAVINESYANNYLTSLFKNATRCSEVVRTCHQIEAQAPPAQA